MLKIKSNQPQLKIARIKNGLYQRDVAEAIGITPNAYAQIENGIRFTTGKTAVRICECLHIQFEDGFKVEEAI